MRSNIFKTYNILIDMTLKEKLMKSDKIDAILRKKLEDRAVTDDTVLTYLAFGKKHMKLKYVHFSEYAGSHTSSYAIKAPVSYIAKNIARFTDVGLAEWIRF
jgi:hypothetical protein